MTITKTFQTKKIICLVKFEDEIMI